MRTMAFDIGDKRIGVAVSDLLGLTAQGLDTIQVRSINSSLDEMEQLIHDNEVTTVVVGYPKNMDGTIGPRAEKSIRYKEALEERLDVTVKLWDERLTTMSAQRTLLEADVSRSKRKKVVDKIAAVLILQGFLDNTAHKTSL
ncbi:Holliday junction resolvase RuvX [Geomicrobium sediminis]|uniref:Putative pre-16S rRNA nuclease n=1 Tax=Geomicrobium sediminis TaxID=1347788 RepID=A0ABS2PFQ8_9BACL|nr:Holliday junction resolvase RuvX [Geomicrobium sediminis]MBM7633895.1 putative Holliday junction resolvase [Geomicrobium sediminis]